MVEWVHLETWYHWVHLETWYHVVLTTVVVHLSHLSQHLYVYPPFSTPISTCSTRDQTWWRHQTFIHIQRGFFLCIISEISFYFYYTYSKTLNINTYVGLITIARVDLPRCFALEFWQFSYTEPINPVKWIYKFQNALLKFYMIRWCGITFTTY